MVSERLVLIETTVICGGGVGCGLGREGGGLTRGREVAWGHRVQTVPWVSEGERTEFVYSSCV